MPRVLVFSTLFPNAAQPNHGVFVENRLRHTLALGGLEATVVAPAPFFPAGHPMFGRYAAFARVPGHETRHGVEVRHPRYPVVPKLGASLTPGALFRAGLVAFRTLHAAGQRFDVIDAHYFYPDGVAAARLAQALRLPLVITGRGTDLTLIPSAPGPRRAIRWAAQEASVSIGVCEDLRQRLADLGAPPDRTLVLRNGVDLRAFRFAPRPPPSSDRPFVLASVGSLIPRKGHELVIAALAQLPDCRLLIAGSGPMRAELEALARRLGVAARVRFLGEVAHSALPDVYAAADALVLASSREGWANVLLEAMACGTPVVATDVNGTREAVCAPAAGVLAQERSTDGLVAAIRRLRQAPPDRRATRRHAERFGWEPIARANRALLLAAAEAGFERRYDPAIAEAARRELAAPTRRRMAEPAAQAAVA